MFHLCKFKLIIFFVIVALEIISGAIINDTTSKKLPDGLVRDLYKNYRAAVGNGNRKESLRRLFSNNKEYKIHVKKLKEVNGYKPHNLYIEEESILGKPLVYINNPVESRFPNPYLTLTEFQDQLTRRIQKQKDDLSEKNSKRLTKPQNNIKDLEIIEEDRSKEGISKIYKPTRTNSILRNNLIVNRTDTKRKKHVKRETSQQTTTKFLKKIKLRKKINSTNQVKRIKKTNSSKSSSLSANIKIETFSKPPAKKKRLRSKLNSTIREPQLKLRNTNSKIHNVKLINKTNNTTHSKKIKLRNKVKTAKNISLSINFKIETNLNNLETKLKNRNKTSSVKHVKQLKLINKTNGTVKRTRSKQNITLNKIPSHVNKSGKIVRAHSKGKLLMRNSTVKSKKTLKHAVTITGSKTKHKVQNKTTKVRKDRTTVHAVEESNLGTVNGTETISSNVKISSDNTTENATEKLGARTGETEAISVTNSEVTTVTSNNEAGDSTVQTSENANEETKASDAEVTTADSTTIVGAEVTSENANEEKETTTLKTTTLSTKRTWKTLGRPAVYMGGSGFD